MYTAEGIGILAPRTAAIIPLDSIAVRVDAIEPKVFHKVVSLSFRIEELKDHVVQSTRATHKEVLLGQRSLQNKDQWFLPMDDLETKR